MLATNNVWKLQKTENSEQSGKFPIGNFCIHLVWPGCIFVPKSNATSKNCVAIASENLPV